VSDLEALAGSLGIDEGTSIVLVPLGLDGTELGTATWPYWVLRYLGHEDVAILDGGLAAWRADPANPTAPGAAPLPAAGFAVSIRPEILVGTAEVAELVGSSTVTLDARPADQYRGESMSGLVVRPGHIPGAINLPFSSFYDEAAHRLRSFEELTAIAEAVVPDRNADIVVYCNTGHWSSIVWFVLREVLGYQNVRLYEESMAQWSREAALPLVLGAAP
jgi:thiosulfate/3-mercaptopyruvate sulfurtransferase